MLTFLRSSIFESPAQTLVNTVNTEGVMGKGIAKTFKEAYPDMFREYAKLCKDEKLSIGGLHLWRGRDKWVLNFPTKQSWRRPSKVGYIEAGLDKFVSMYAALGISSISFPPLGCGNGGLSWQDVRPIMEAYLRPLPINVFIHDRQVPSGFLAEHASPAATPPGSYEEFLTHLRRLIYANRGRFQTINTGGEFEVHLDMDGTMKIIRKDKTEILAPEVLADAWAALQVGLLSRDQYSGAVSKRYKTYIFALLAQLPYVRVAEIERPRIDGSSPGHGLYLLPSSREEDQVKETTQGKLWEFQ